MLCTYINLKSRSDKKALIEASFDNAKIEGWELTRFEAIDKNSVESNNVQGSLPSGEKGCFLSHRNIIQNAFGSQDHLFIVEDDVVFGKLTFSTIDSIITSMDQPWDILFLDICIPVPEGMIQLFNLSKHLKSEGAVTLLDLSDKAFASAASYIVNRESIEKLGAILAQFNQINIPIDLVYKELIHSKKLKAFVTFPFLTTLSGLSEKSDLQTYDGYVTELTWHTFRKLVWNEASREQYQENLLALSNLQYDKGDEDFSLLLKAFINKGFVNK